MNYAEKMERENRLKTNLAEWMLRHGEVLSGRSRSNEYVGIWMAEVLWRGSGWDSGAKRRMSVTDGDA